MIRKTGWFSIIAFIMVFIATVIGGGNFRGLLSPWQSEAVDSYLEDAVKTVNQETNAKVVEFQAIGKGDDGSLKDVILNYNGDYNNKTIGNQVLEYSRNYFKVISKNNDIKGLKTVSLRFQLTGLDEKGQKAKSVPSVTILVSRMSEINWNNLSPEDLQKVAVCHLDPTIPE